MFQKSNNCLIKSGCNCLGMETVRNKFYLLKLSSHIWVGGFEKAKKFLKIGSTIPSREFERKLCYKYN